MTDVLVQQQGPINRAQVHYFWRTVLRETWIFIHWCIDFLIDCVFGLIYNSTRVHIAPITNPLIRDSATTLAHKIRTKAVKCEDVVQAFVDRIQNVNGVINAVVDDRFEEALAEARQVDEDLQKGWITNFTQKPFLGVPFTAKESTACKGLSNTFGLKCRAGVRGEEDAEIVKLMKNAGGILLGVTNMPQLNLWQETSNPLFGVTSNPYNNTRHVGGSSGGEGSIVAACGSPIGLGTDIGGSIRIPAFTCGVFGHKITTSLISTKGLTFRTGSDQPSMLTAGPLTKYADDLAPLIKIMVGPKITKLKLDTNVDVKSLKVLYISDNHDISCSKMSDELSRVFQRAVNHFVDISREAPKQLDIEEMKYGGKLWRYWMTQEPEMNFRRDITNRERTVSPFKEALKYLIGRSEYNLAVIANLIDSTLPMAKDDWARKLTSLLQEYLIQQLDTDGVLLYPSAPFTAGYHHTSFLRPYNFHYFCIWSVLKFPVTQVPMGLSKEGLPLGIQVVAAPFQDHLCLAVAKELETVFGGYKPPLRGS